MERRVARTCQTVHAARVGRKSEAHSALIGGRYAALTDYRSCSRLGSAVSTESRSPVCCGSSLPPLQPAGYSPPVTHR